MESCNFDKLQEMWYSFPMEFNRTIEPQLLHILSEANPPIVVVYGPRRVGKTTLTEKLVNTLALRTRMVYGDDPDIQRELLNIGLSGIQQYVAPYDLIVFDEAQYIPNIGGILKLIADHIKDKKILVTGSSSMNIATSISEPLTGRKKVWNLYPIADEEMRDVSIRIPETTLSSYLRYGMYPVVLNTFEETEKEDYLRALLEDYIYKDALHIIGERNREPVRRLLIALAYQIGQEVSYTELSRIVGLDYKTVMKYIDILEECFVIFRLPAFSRNMRIELRKSRKIYFVDVGIRNALIDYFVPFDKRNDRGGLWENWVIMERIKHDRYHHRSVKRYFWRTHDQKEVDLIEEEAGQLTAIEIKWNSSKTSTGQHEFRNLYPKSTLRSIDHESYRGREIK